MTQSLLPPTATRLEHALERAMSMRISAIPVPIRTLNNPDTCPAHLLGWLAWANSVDVWDEAWPEAHKRAAIKASFFVHAHKGTIGAVRRALEALGIGLEIREWFETGDPRGTFRIDAFADYVFGAGYSLNPALFAMIAAQIDTTKRASQHYTLRVGERNDAVQPIRSGARSIQRHRADIAPQPRTYDALAALNLRSASRFVRIHRHTHDVQVRAAA